MNPINLNSFYNFNNIKNYTSTQKRNNTITQEGVLVNSAIINDNFSNINNNLLIPEKGVFPKLLLKNKNQIDDSILSLSTISLLIMSLISLITGFMYQNTKNTKNTVKEKWLPAVTRNVNLSKETSQIIYQMVQSPNKKTFIAGAGVLVLSSIAFIGKMFMDGFKDVWIKRKEANIQKNLQENLINVETNAFAGKNQIIKAMLSKYSKDFHKILITTKSSTIPDNQTNFTGKTANIYNKKNILNFLLGIFTTTGIGFLGYISLKNLSKSVKNLENLLDITKNSVKQIVQTSNDSTKDIDKANLEHLIISIDGTKNIENFVKQEINNLNWSNKDEKSRFLNYLLTKIRTSTIKVNPNIGGDGTPKPAFNSFVDDYKAFFYNWLLEPSNSQFKQLFLGITGLTAISYGGKIMGDAIKEIQVKKINANTELELQKKLVSTELRNFKSKKDSIVIPLVEDFYKHVKSGNKNNEELKIMAENILNEIKNGPPYVYS